MQERVCAFARGGVPTSPWIATGWGPTGKTVDTAAYLFFVRTPAVLGTMWLALQERGAPINQRSL